MIDGDRIRQAIKVAKANGYKITDGVWCSPKNRTCCALGAVAIEMGLSEYDLKSMNLSNVIANEIGISGIECLTFIEGFDGGPCEDSTYTEAYDLGRSIRAEELGK